MPSALIVDDEADVRFLLRQVIELDNHDITVAGEAASGEEALAQWEEAKPAVIVLDNRMPGVSGLDVAEQILREHPEQSIILFSAQLDVETLHRANELGIRACLGKNDYFQIPEAIRKYAPASA
ncbi:MAG TPA: response regulator transcription factor [Mycobacteriales bacterium]|nr:response regulator transcription factor [Mycobacteriales bacterium]